MKVLVILLSFLFCIPVIAQVNKPLQYPYHKTPFSTSPVTIDHFEEVLEGLNDYDVKYYELNLQVSKLNTEISGDAVIYAQVQTAGLDTLYLELIDTVEANSAYMVVDSVWVNNLPADYIHQDNMIKIVISPSLPVNTYFYCRVFYHGDGNHGIWHEFEYNCYRTYTASEPFRSKYWFPCKQILVDKADSVRILITTDSDCLAGSNGLLKSVTLLPDNKIRYEWVSHYPIAYYLISFAVGQYIDYKTYVRLDNSTDSILIQNYLNLNDPNLPTQLVAIEKVKQNIQSFSDLFGEYPFSAEKYGHCIAGGGMENQTMTTIGSLFLDTSMNNLNSGWLGWVSAHELSHSWFGDNVTCGSWQDIWVNEGFATYAEYLAIYNNDSHQAGDEFMDFIQLRAKTYIDRSVYVPEEHANDGNYLFDPFTIYCKGATLLHMIRFIVNNDSLFFQALKNYETVYAGSTATGLDFKGVLESTTQMDFTDYFDEWYFGQGYPVFNIYYYQQNDTLNINSVQTTASSETPLFHIPVELKLYYPGGDTTIRYNQYDNNVDYTIVTNHPVNQIVFDPNHWLVAYGYVHMTSATDNELLERKFNLSQNYPNPFNPITNINYQIPQTSFLTLKVYDVLGNEVATLVNEEKPAGSYTVKFNGSNLASGIYFYKLKAGNFNQTRKMIILK